MALHYITPTTHSAVKKVSFFHKHFDTTWSSPKITSFRKNLTTKHIFCWLTHIHYILPWITKTALIYTRSNLLSQRDTTYKNKYSPHHHSLPHFPLPRNLNLYLPIQHLAGFTTALFTPHKHMAHHNTTNTATHKHLHTPTQANTPTVATLFFSLPLTTRSHIWDSNTNITFETNFCPQQ